MANIFYQKVDLFKKGPLNREWSGSQFSNSAFREGDPHLFGLLLTGFDLFFQEPHGFGSSEWPIYSTILAILISFGKSLIYEPALFWRVFIILDYRSCGGEHKRAARNLCIENNTFLDSNLRAETGRNRDLAVGLNFECHWESVLVIAS